MQNGKEISKQGAKRKVDGSLHRHGENPDGSSFDAYSKVSEDGASITDEITVRGKDSNESKEKFVYHRVMGKTGAGAEQNCARSRKIQLRLISGTYQALARPLTQ